MAGRVHAELSPFCRAGAADSTPAAALQARAGVQSAALYPLSRLGVTRQSTEAAALPVIADLTNCQRLTRYRVKSITTNKKYSVIYDGTYYECLAVFKAWDSVAKNRKNSVFVVMGAL